MEHDPYMAMETLKSIDRSRFSSIDSAYYALLYTQAQVKTDEPIKNDSLINKAYQHYHISNSGDLCVRAYFYHGTVLNMHNRRTDALRDFLTALEIAEIDKNYEWAARSAEAISDIFVDSYNYEQAEDYSNRTVAYFNMSGNELRKRYAIIDLATIHLNNGKTSLAIKSLDSLNNIFSNAPDVDENLKAYLKIPYTTALIREKRSGEAERMLASYPKDSTNYYNTIEWMLTQGKIDHLNSNYSDAKKILYDALLLSTNKEDSIRLMYWTYRSALSTEDYKYAASMADTLLILQSEIADFYLKESLTGVQRDFISAKANKDRHRFLLTTTILITALIITLGFTILLFFNHRLRIRAKKAELEATLATLTDVQSLSEKKDEQINSLNSKLTEESNTNKKLQSSLENFTREKHTNAILIESLFKEKWTTLNKLCDEYFDLDNSDRARMVILNRLDKEIKKICNKKSLQKIEDSVNLYIDNIIAKIRIQCPFLSDDELILLSLIFAGFSVRTICLLQNIKYKNFYLRKSRIIKRITDSDAPDKNLFITKIKQTSDHQQVKPIEI